MTTQLYFLKTWFQNRLETAEERGANLVEYILLVGLIVLVCVAAIFFLGGAVRDKFQSTGSGVASAGS